jgi:hypothetical protein
MGAIMSDLAAADIASITVFRSFRPPHEFTAVELDSVKRGDDASWPALPPKRERTRFVWTPPLASDWGIGGSRHSLGADYRGPIKIPPLWSAEGFERVTECEPLSEPIYAADGWVFHPAANIFPLMTKAELEMLAANIKEHGLIEPIRTLGGMIIVGRNRYNACLAVGVEPRFDEMPKGWNGDLLALVIASNRHRKQWTGMQLAWVALGIAETEHGGARPGSGPKKSVTEQWVNSSVGGQHLNSDPEGEHDNDQF